MPRTTINLDASVLAELRRRAAREEKSLGRLTSELLAHKLAGEVPTSELEALKWISRDLVIPRFDLEDKEKVYLTLQEQSSPILDAPH
jgi:plasmid stability protein